MQQIDNFYVPPQAPASEQEAVSFNFERLLAGKYFIQLVSVIANNGDNTIDVLPLVQQQDTAGNPIQNAVIYNIPISAVQAGASAIKMQPNVGDFGIIAICDKDITQAKIAKSQSAPPTKRNHSLSDAIYLFGIPLMNSPATQYIEFTESNGINIVSPNGTHFTGPVTTSATITASGDVTGAGISLSTHVHGGVQSGGSKTSTPE